MDYLLSEWKSHNIFFFLKLRKIFGNSKMSNCHFALVLCIKTQ